MSRFYFFSIIFLFFLHASNAKLPKWFKNIKKGSSSSSASHSHESESVLNPAAYQCYRDRKGTQNVKNCPPLVNDPEFTNQWYIMRSPIDALAGSVPVELNIIETWWKYNVFGEGVVVVVADDAVEADHPDLKTNYNHRYSISLLADQEISVGDDHGTQVAGIIAMEMNNRKHGVGVAPLASLGAARVYPGDDFWQSWLQDSYENLMGVHIITHGYSDQVLNRHYFPNVERLIEVAHTFTEGLEKTAKNLGIIHIVGVGNKKSEGITCAFNEATSPYVMFVAASAPSGEITNYSQRCANIMITAPSGPTSTINHVPTTSIRGRFVEDFGQTSAATPIVVGIIALTLSARPDLTRRDITHLIAWTGHCSSKYINNYTFITNQADFIVSHDFGFGMINAEHMIRKALQFQSVPDVRTCTIKIRPNVNYLNHPDSLYQAVETTACAGTRNEVNYLEHVQLTVKMSHSALHYLEIQLYSPYGTRATLLEPETPRNFTAEFEWNFLSVITWGENPRGTWTINMATYTVPPNESNSVHGRIRSMSLTFWGTKEKPPHYHK